ncbi:MAG: TetR/AcrR family transcriptional regulator [candidate division Zixibacteria bacterium]|nr:TetR/AcrR family transcriptional regulator [candidate division Zixibacteria bacterium]
MESEDRKHQIILESTRLFSQSGFDRVTIKQLADACGITEPALYRYFPSKDAIYDAVLDSIQSQMQYQELFARLEKEPEIGEVLFGLARHILGFFTTHRELYRLLLYSTLGEHSKAKAVYLMIRGPFIFFLLEQLKRLAAEGKLKPKNFEITARCFVGMVFDCALSGMVWRGFTGRTYEPDEIIANNIPIFIDGLSAPKAPGA